MRKLADADLQVLLPDGSTCPLSRFWWPTATLMVAAFLLVISLFVPYWQMVLRAPQYPSGLKTVVFINRLQGDVDEIDGLNHYLGMPSLQQGGRVERAIALYAVSSMALLLLAAVFIHNRWAALAALPALTYPLAFLADMQVILYRYGHSIDPNSALGNAVKPFTPPLWGTGHVGQFVTESSFGPGLWLAIASTALVLVALWLHRAAYKPVLEARMRVQSPHRARAAIVALLVIAAAGAGPAEGAIVTVRPGQSIAAAVHAARAGDVVRVSPGLYHEHLTVDKPLTLQGVGRPLIDGGQCGTVVTLQSRGIVFRGFEVRASGLEPDQNDAAIAVNAADVVVADNILRDVLNGIFLSRADRVLIQNNDISGKDQLESGRKGDGIRLWYSQDARVQGNRIHQVRDVVAWYSARLLLRHNQVDHSRYGLHFMYADNARVEDNCLRDNSVGIYIMYSHDFSVTHNQVVGSRGPSGYALGFKDTDNVTVSGNQLLDNRVGMFMDGAPLAVDAYCRITDNLLAYNDVGISLLPSVKRAVCQRNTFTENQEQVAVLGGGTAVSNDWNGNLWSDYNGYDADGDGIGDVPYRADELFENLTDRHPVLGLLHMSLAQQAVDMAARMFPLVRPVPKLEDARPRVAVASLLATPPAGLAWPLAAAAAGLLLAPGIPGLRRRVREASSPLAAIEVRGLRKRFGQVVAAQDVTLSLQPGEALALWGPNGAGKTTVLRCLLGLLPCEGQMWVAGHDVRRDGIGSRQKMGYVPQELRFHDDLTVDETLRFYASLRGVPIQQAVPQLQRVGLLPHRDKKISALSGGCKQRLALALALLGNPPVLLLDEPTSNLDQAGRQEFLGLLLQLKAQGKALLFSAHHVEEVAPVADRVMLMEQGRVVRVCAPGELK